MAKNVNPTPTSGEDDFESDFDFVPAEEEIAETPEEEIVPEEDYTEKLPVEEVVSAPVVTGDVPPALYSVTTSGEYDDIYLSKMIPNNIHATRVLSVFHLQRRLADWGCRCIDENEGFYGEGTINAVKKFQEMKGFEPTGLVTLEMLKVLFEGDDNVRLHA